MNNKIFISGWVLTCGLAYLSFSQISLWKDGLTLFDYAIDKNPESFSAHLHMGNALFNVKQYEASLQHLKRALDLKPVGYVATDIAIVYNAMDRRPEALPYLQKAVALNPKDEQGNLLLGEALYRFGKKDESVPYLQTAIALGSQLDAAPALLAQYFDEKGQLPETMDYLKTLLRINPLNQAAINRLQALEQGLQASSHY